MIGRGPHARRQTTIRPFDWPGLRCLFTDRNLLTFAGCVLLPIAAQRLSGVSGAVFGVMLPLLAADIIRRTSHFNLCMGALGLAVSLGARFSTAFGGWIADTASVRLAFAALASVGMLATLVLWLAMPETRRD